jgi:hypothetical protein
MPWLCFLDVVVSGGDPSGYATARPVVAQLMLDAATASGMGRVTAGPAAGYDPLPLDTSRAGTKESDGIVRSGRLSNARDGAPFAGASSDADVEEV